MDQVTLETTLLGNNPRVISAVLFITMVIETASVFKKNGQDSFYLEMDFCPLQTKSETSILGKQIEIHQG